MQKYHFERLDVWTNSIDLSTEIYRITRKYPQEEKYSLSSQIRRSAVSVPSHIAEGNARFSSKEKIRFIRIAYGSLMETLNHLIISRKLEYINERQYIDFRKRIDLIANQLNKLRNFHSNQ